ncbi:MAG: VPLPA-CTERM sorting domain-containing protein [Geminicoccaceae bacterium]
MLDRLLAMVSGCRMAVLAGGLAVAWIVTPMQAWSALYNISWTGSGGYTMSGQFSFSDSLLSSTRISGSDLQSLSIEGFLNGTSVGSWDLLKDGVTSPTPLNFNFNPLQGTFYLSGAYDGPNGQYWNYNGSFGFISFMDNGQTTQAIKVDGTGRGVTRPNSTLTATPVPLPAALPLLASGIAALGWVRRRQRKVA